MIDGYSRLSLRTKISGIALAITVFSLAVVATAGILQIRHQMAVEERRSADAIAFSFSRSAELEMSVGDKRDLARLTTSYVRDPNLLFVAAYDPNGKLLTSAASNPVAWQQFLKGTLKPGSCIISRRTVEALDQTDEFTGESDALTLSGPTIAKSAKPVGTIVIGLSTAAQVQAQTEQNRLTVCVAMLAATIGGVVLFLTLGRWMRRLQKLADASLAISAGNFTGEISDRANDEIGRLARSFDDMRSALRKRDEELRNFTDTLQVQVKARTKDLQAALTAAEDANKAKSLFLANMSHELRTPLNGVIGMVDLLLAAEPSQQQRRYCDIAKSSAKSLVDLINDILDFSKIEAGKLELDNTDFNLHEAIEGAPQILGERAQKKGIELLCRLDPALPRIVGGDPVRLRQVILNLVSNAVKFTETGEVIVDARLEDQTQTYSEIRVSVTDSGIGIPRSRLDRLFKSFSQVDASTTRKFGGTGLGLAISQRIVEMMDGQIGVNSVEGKGSTFWFTVKLDKRSQLPAVGNKCGADPRGVRVLAVDDNKTNQEILQSQLISWFLRADIAGDAQQALAMLKVAAASGDPYRFAIIDMHMPRTDGMQLGSRIKNDLSTRDVVLISLSSISDPIRRDQMGEYGFAACLTKPVLPSQLYDTIVSLLAAKQTDQTLVPLSTTTRDRLDGVHVLLAEDNEVNRLVATELLQLIGCTVKEAVNGYQAVQMALSERFDLMLMDCQMPVLDGFEATRTIRKAELEAGNSERRKIIALTANAIKGDRELCLEAGMDEYVTKPIEPRDLLRTIQSVLSMNPMPKNKSTASAAVADPTPQAASSATASDVSAPAPVNVESLTRRCINNRKLAAKALRMFDSGIDRDLEALTRSVEQRDPEAVAVSAHKIKGAAANISAEEVRKVAAELEKLGRTDRLEQSQEALESLSRQISVFRSYLGTALQELTPLEPPGRPPAATPQNGNG